ncbi:MAG TPA: bifunctional diaminohydroxyphosphoribosylaminopyrimidine deaminase/5-amino-6-(5-phosphoribosylamino)uracil reductase RibD [Aequorivita sp.]|nr:bifunctional diaminohydroxyphosphoribosylaminopyrimidine deaminase/5-amino-6-(5-phosphoribosylamino)uracil reductase RibD [Aequorivita sp.]
MQRCIQLAKNGLGTSYPNPLVGSVIVKNDRIIGEGWHQKAGMPHAEVNAFASVGKEFSLEGATLYVSLEPCSHFGKTPPCADLIISKRVRKVVIGSTDPNPKVAGNGIKKLREAGCEVITGILERECIELNKRFFRFHQKKRPYIFLKWAQTSNGFIAPLKQARNETKPVWITNAYSRQLVHKMRSEEMAILVGTQTVLDDNPSLTVRDWAGSNPLRLVIDRKLQIPDTYSIFDPQAKTIVFNERESRSSDNIEYVIINFNAKLPEQISEVLFKKNIQSLIVEGGAKTLQSFVEANIWDEAWVFTGPNSFEGGIEAPGFYGNLFSRQKIKEDVLDIFKHSTS